MIDEDGGKTLTSHIGSSSMFVASSELKALIERCCGDVEVEYIDFRLLDRRRKPMSSDYWIINPMGTLDCLSLALCGADDDEDADLPPYVECLILDSKKMSSAPSMFRPREDSEMIIFREDVAMALKGKFTNLQLCELSFDTDDRICAVDSIDGRQPAEGEPWDPGAAWTDW